jgi:hypothetical protein
MFKFAANSTMVQVQSRIRRIVDLTVPNLSAELHDDRVETRNNRTLPAFLCPWERNRPRLDEHTFVVTKDLSSDGVALVLAQPFRVQDVLLGFWLNVDVMDQPYLFLGQTQNLQELGGGFWTLGAQLTEFVTPGQQREFSGLMPLLSRLRV